jgi:hypothetical protein
LKVETITSIPVAIQAAMTAQCNLIGQGGLGIPQLPESGIPAKIISTLLRYHSECHSADFWVLKDSL